MYPEFQEDLRLFELSETSSASEVKSKYKLLAKVWHPDRFQHDEELCKEASKKLAQINNAYQRLKQHVESGNSFTVEEEYEEAEPYEAEEEGVVEAQESSQEPESVANENDEIPVAENPMLKARKYRSFKSLTVFSMVTGFALIGLMIIDYNFFDFIPESWEDFTGGFMLLAMVAGVISYSKMRHYSDKPEKYY